MTIARRLSLSLPVALALAVAAPAAHARPRTIATQTSPAALREPARAFLKLDAHLDRPTRGLYVGQAVPITIRAYFLGGTGVTMNGLPRVTSDSFELSNLSETPRQSQAEARGLPYTLLTWNGVLTAVREGPAKTDIELPVALSYREVPLARPIDDAADASAGQSSGDDQTSEDPFEALLRQSPLASDPTFAQMFKRGSLFRGMFEDLGGAVRRRDVTLRDTAGILNVAALPPNRPADFTGAVGSFEISVALGDEPLRVGEPATLTLTVHGQGSFSRMSLSGLKSSDSLSAYGVTSTFKPDGAPLSGEKVFKQTIVPRRDGVTTLPSATLTYFDPVEQRYVSRHTTPLGVTVAANAGDEAHPANPTTSSGNVPTAAIPATAAVVNAVPDVTRTSLTPVVRTRAFWALALALALASAALAAIGFLRRRGALARVATNRRVRREISTCRRSMSAAADRGDAAAMFAAGRAALQARLGATWGVPSEAIAAADVSSRLGERGERIREVFERADRLTYSRARTARPEDLTRWQGLITDELGSLEVTS